MKTPGKKNLNFDQYNKYANFSAKFGYYVQNFFHLLIKIILINSVCKAQLS